VLTEAVVDRDTLGLAGAPSINDAILTKIRDADAFVADVSLINLDRDDGSGGANTSLRPTPNPNVLTELGYAMAALGTEAMVLVVNTHHGTVEQLPFDLRPLRKLTYCAAPDDDLGAIRKCLENDLAHAIKLIGESVRGDPVDAILYERTRDIAGQARGLFFALAEGRSNYTTGDNRSRIGQDVR